MKCVICKQGETSSGTATVTLERGSTTVLIKDVPAQVCDNCGEAYIEDTLAAQLLAAAEQAAGQGVVVDVREFVAACVRLFMRSPLVLY